MPPGGPLTPSKWGPLRCCFGSKFKKGQTETVTLCRRPCKRCRRRRRRELRPPPSRSLVSTLHTHSPAPPAPPHLKAQHPSLLKLDPPRGTNGLVVRRGDWLRTASHPSPARRGKGPLRGRRRRVIQMDGRLGRASLSAAPRGTPWSDAPAGPWTPLVSRPGTSACCSSTPQCSQRSTRRRFASTSVSPYLHRWPSYLAGFGSLMPDMLAG